ncbi:efflux RND transporter periplasmic adaptor subunit [Parachryseolinea silvisoli]|uniref:efflux RND transporter periplasmic adaptor subunit n=1 Tax=Parachryseolinea silvisoli TaxID=2873601 RepID=UPI0022659DE5|nr:efflux RND transporter periplasmic adaptor subunit [Parachryseolinea silvisoli]MCD9020077.1 efflux RND transporter periplasmic adaptor subunit [Parachryseolinea silvisoli]
MSVNTIQNYSVLGLLLLAVACGKKDQPGAMQGPPPAGVVLHEVKASDAVYYDEYPATIRALNEVELRAQVSGYITAIHFTEGEVVKKGQKLYSIDQQQYQANYQQAQANLAVQEANLIKAQRDVERYRELAKSDAIAKQQVDYAEAAYSAALKQVDAAKASVQGVQTNVRYSTITAPFEGTIGISQVRLGAAVSAGQTLLNTISSDNPIAADITVDQKEILRFTQLQAKGQSPKDSTFRLAFGGEVYNKPGKISVIDRAVDQNTGSIRMRLTFPNDGNVLRAGMSGTLQVLSTSNTAAVLVPYKAVTEQLGEFFVYVTIPENKVTQRKVVLGQQIGNNVIVKSGLQAGETIVVEGVQNLREGASYAVVQPGAAPGAPAAGAPAAGAAKPDAKAEKK